MVSGKSPQSLPPGWTEHIRVTNGRKIKYYVNEEVGRKFYSKTGVIRYVETGCICHGTSEQTSEHDKGGSEQKPTPLRVITPETPEWLPDGWTIELKTRKSGRQYKCYIEPLTQSKFYSKPEVSKYLGTVKGNSCLSLQREMGIGSVSDPEVGDLNGGATPSKIEGSQNFETLKGTSSTSTQKQAGLSKQSTKRVVIERVAPDGLPPGWIKEVKIEKKANRIRKDPFYTDPVSGYVFHSKKDALRYVETGDTNTCAVKPKKRNNLRFLSEEAPQSPDVGELNEGTTPLELEKFQSLGTIEGTSCTSQQKQTELSKQSRKKVEIERVTPDRLPPGWIKEIKIFYTDPVSGYVFYSKKDALRYVETGDAKSCIIKPKKRGELGFLSEQTSENPGMGELNGGTAPRKLEGSQNLETLKGTSCTSIQKQTELSTHSAEKVLIERVIPDELPPGWIKEIKIEKKANRIRKDSFYTDPVSGYVFHSKKDALRYVETGDVNSCAVKPKKRDQLRFLSEESSPSPDIVEPNGTANPPKARGSQNWETVKGTSCKSIQKETDFSNLSSKEVVIERAIPDGLPPGWIKEIKIEKKANGIRKDPFYTDSVSGYVFRSQKDALRYVKTGNVSSCAIKPRKRNELGFLSEDASESVPSVADMRELGHCMTKRQISGGTKYSAKTSLETTDVKRQRTNKSSVATITSTATAEIPEGKHKPRISNDPRSSPLQRGSGSKRKQGERASATNKIVSTPSAEMVPEENLEENGNRKKRIDSSKSIKKKPPSLPSRSAKSKIISTPSTEMVPEEKSENGNKKKRINSSKSITKKPPSLPSRSSNRLAALKTEMIANLPVNEQELGAAATEADENEVNPSPKFLDNGAPSIPKSFQIVSETNPSQELLDSGAPSVPQSFQIVSETGIQIANLVLTGIDAPSDKPLEDQPVREDQPASQETENRDGEDPDSNLYAFGDSWSDPCLDFAIKTLTGDVPATDNVVVQDQLRQQVDTSTTHQEDSCLSLLDFGTPNTFQSNILSNSDAPKPISVSQFPASLTLLPPENNRLPGSNRNAPQEPSLEGNNDKRTKVNS